MNSPTISEPKKLNAHISEVQANCQKHGEYAARSICPFPGMSPMVSSCPACSAEAAAEAAQFERRKVEWEKQAKLSSLLKRSLIPARFEGRTLANYRVTTPSQKRVHAIATRYAEAFGTQESRGASLILAGKPGTGKTHIACGIAREIIEKHQRSAVFMTVLQALRHVKDTYRRDAERTEADAIKDLLMPDLLILDEIGAQLGSEHEKMLMFEIINERYQDCRSTILISNLNGEELSQFMGDRVMDRFREAGAIVAFDWESHRGTRGDL